jgi:hypothetical protein
VAPRRQVRKQRQQNLNSHNFKETYAERHDSIGVLWDGLPAEPGGVRIGLRGSKSMDAGHGWRIFVHEVYIMGQDERPKELAEAWNKRAERPC